LKSLHNHTKERQSKNINSDPTPTQVHMLGDDVIIAQKLCAIP